MSQSPPERPPQDWQPHHRSPQDRSPQDRSPQDRRPPERSVSAQARPVESEHSLATVAFTLGILSVVGMPFVGPVAWALGRRAVREIDARPDVLYRNRGVAVTGMILGIVGTVMLILAVLAVTAALGLLVALNL